MSQQPPNMQTRTQVEFGPEENKTFSALSVNMGTVAMLMNLIGLAFLIFFGLSVYQAIQKQEGYASTIAMGVAMLVFLTIGFQTYLAGRSFRRVVETQSRDAWHLMNALETLRGMYGLLRFIIIAGVVLMVVAFVVWLVGRPSGG